MPDSPTSSMRPTAQRRLSLVSSHLQERSSTTSPPLARPRSRLAPSSSAFRYFLPFQSTWRDNDQYSHFNNVIYSQYFDSITNEFLLNQCKMNSTTDPIGLIVHSETSFNQQLSYPQPVLAALSISTLSSRKIVWNLGLFDAEYTSSTSENVPQGEYGRRIRIKRDKEGKEVRAAAWGTMTHVFVERHSEGRNKVVDELPEGWGEKLRGLVVSENEGGEGEGGKVGSGKGQ
ncbi:hypothetical protein JCM16303_004417 [Sporobolomyces ruberrimus]